MFDRICGMFAFFLSFVELGDWHSLPCCELIAVTHPDLVPYGLWWHVVPYSWYIRWWVLKVCWLNTVQNTMYADDVFLVLNYWN